MSKIIWSHQIEPEVSSANIEYSIYSPPLVLENTKSFSQKTKDLVTLPDRKAYRSMSRAGVLLSAVGLEAQNVLKRFIEKDSFCVGVYCAIENGPENYDCVKALLETSDEDFAEVYKKNRSPKDYLAQLPNLAPAQLGIFLEINGPINIYTHSKHSCLHALEQAEADLMSGSIEYALICSAFSLEDALLSLRTQRSDKDKILSEGAGAMILAKSDELINWSSLINKDLSKINYGISTDLIELIKKGEQ